MGLKIVFLENYDVAFLSNMWFGGGGWSGFLG